MDGNQARALLGVPAFATSQQVRHAFRRVAFVAHPDRGGSPATFRRLVDARDLLLQAAPSALERPEVDVFQAAIRSPRPTWSTTDCHRRPPAASPETEPDFETVLARAVADRRAAA